MKALTHDEAISVGAKTLVGCLFVIVAMAIFGEFLMPQLGGKYFGAGVAALGCTHMLPFMWATCKERNGEMWHVWTLSLLGDVAMLLWVRFVA